MDTFTIGQDVVIRDKFHASHPEICRGKVERFTKTMIIVRNQHGNVSRFRRDDSKQVGFCWPYCTHYLAAN